MCPHASMSTAGDACGETRRPPGTLNHDVQTSFQKPLRLSTASTAIRDKFLQLEARHHRDFQDILVGISAQGDGDPAGGGEGPEHGKPNDAAPAASELDELENEAAASAASGGFAAKCPSAVAGVQILLGNDETIYLMASGSDVVTLPALTHLGGVGGGSFQPRSNINDSVVPYEFPNGASTSACPLKPTRQACTRAFHGIAKPLSMSLFPLSVYLSLALCARCATSYTRALQLPG